MLLIHIVTIVTHSVCIFYAYRLMNMCSSFVEELGEEQLYEIYRHNPSDDKAFEKSLCKSNGIFGECIKKQERQRQEL